MNITKKPNKNINQTGGNAGPIYILTGPVWLKSALCFLRMINGAIGKIH
jgi:hypothetical protein